jgi:hypothetical protein
MSLIQQFLLNFLLLRSVQELHRGAMSRLDHGLLACLSNCRGLCLLL